MSELQIMWWLQRLRGQTKPFFKHPIDPTKRSYMVLGHKYAYGVDYGNYMHRVAEEIGAAPSLSFLANSANPYKALYTYCQGQSYIGLFRLQGPYASKQCWKIFTEELYEVCLDRGWMENFGLASITVLSIGMNMFACILECLWCLMTLQIPKFFCRYG